MYAGALREMAMQVFYLPRDNHDENLVFDFGVRKGNKLKWNGGKVEVHSTGEYIVSKGFRYRIIDLNGIDYCMCAYQWIEGIGSDNDFLFWKEDFIVIQYLASCYENDVCIYDWEYLGFDRCNIKAEPFDPNTFDSSEEEAAFHEWVEQHPDSAGYINLWFEGSTLCVKGIMKLGPYPTFAECYTENYYEKKPEDVNEVRFSIYQHKSDSENELMPMWVNLKIGNFQSGIYHFVPNNKGYFAPLLKECTLICE